MRINLFFRNEGFVHNIEIFHCTESNRECILTHMNKEQKILLVLILIVAGAGATFYVSNKQGKTIDPVQGKTGGKEITETTAATNAVVPKEILGIPSSISAPYVSDISYSVPENGTEKIHLTLVVKEGVIEDVRFSFDPPTKRESHKYLTSFSDNLAKAGLKGKKVSEVSLSRVGGASLTTKAFMQAVQEINGKIKV